MSLEIQGEWVIVSHNWQTRIMVSLFQEGFNLVPRVFLNEEADYGVCDQEGILKIRKDRFFHVNGKLREGVRTNLHLKTHSRQLTWRALQEFKAATQIFENAVMRRLLTPDSLFQALDACAKVLALTEYNGCVPFEWFRDELERISTEERQLTMEDFSYCEILPHRQLLRWGKLRLLRQYFLNNYSLNEGEINRFIFEYGYLYPNWFYDLEKRSGENAESVLKEMKTMAQNIDLNGIRTELQQIYRNRLETKLRFENNLQYVTQLMVDQQATLSQIENFLSALNFLSMAMTEEEYRHIWQYRFWRSLSAVIRGLELPATVSKKDLHLALQHCPNFIPDFPGLDYQN